MIERKRNPEIMEMMQGKEGRGYSIFIDATGEWLIICIACIIHSSGHYCLLGNQLRGASWFKNNVLVHLFYTYLWLSECVIFYPSFHLPRPPTQGHRNFLCKPWRICSTICKIVSIMKPMFFFGLMKPMLTYCSTHKVTLKFFMYVWIR